VRYVVMGSVRQADGRLRVGVELSDAMKGTLLWSERYGGEGREVFEIQDRIVRDIVGALAVKLGALEQQRAAAKPPANLEAYELVLRARELMRAVQRPANREARSLIAQAIKLSPGYAEAHAALAYAEFQRTVFGWMEDPSDGLRRTEQAARRALAIDDPGANARAHGILGTLHTFTGNYAAALVDAERAIELNPSDALARSLRGSVLLWTGKIDESIAASETARRYDPRLSAEGMFNLALAYYLAGRYREAAQTAVAVEPNARTVFLRAVQAAALAQLGDAEGARHVAEEVRRLDPFFDVKLFGQRLVNPAHRDKAQEGLLKAGL
jgi:tetratricopeptide (TPR) repeat protein